MSQRALGRQFAYHVSHSKNRESIAEHGLIPGDGKHIWLYPNHEDAAADRHRWDTTDMHGNKMVGEIYKADITGMRTSKDPYPSGQNGRVVKKPIPPERLERLP